MGLKRDRDSPLALDRLHGRAVEVPVRVRPEEYGVARLYGAGVDDAVDNGADVWDGIHLCHGVLEGLVRDKLLRVTLAGGQEVEEGTQLTWKISIS